MKGDFSRLPDERNHNFAGVLHQQGRVLLDADWNAQTAIANGWQDTAGQDIIGAGVAAVPADQPDGFKIASTTHAAGTTNVQLTVNPGRVWADGLLARLFGEPAYCQLTRGADYRIRERGPHDDEMGAFGFLREAHKWRNLQIRFREFMPVGVRPLLIAVT